VRHLDPDRLVLLALDDAPADGGETSHLTGCTACRAELDALREVARLGAQTQDVRELPPPPERVWQRITAELADAHGRAAAPGPVGAPFRSRRPRWRSSGWARPALAAAAAAVLAVAGTVAVTELVRRPAEPAVTASARLDRLPTAPATVAGDARVLQSGDGEERLHLHVTGLPLSTGYYEVWLINPDSERMISVGTLGRAADALLTLPVTVDLNAYRVVDVSAEQYDGQPAHSGQSLLRGALTS
jgi:anti-sigma-K factor RskA